MCIGNGKCMQQSEQLNKLAKFFLRASSPALLVFSNWCRKKEDLQCLQRAHKTYVFTTLRTHIVRLFVIAHAASAIESGCRSTVDRRWHKHAQTTHNDVNLTHPLRASEHHHCFSILIFQLLFFPFIFHWYDFNGPFFVVVVAGAEFATMHFKVFCSDCALFFFYLCDFGLLFFLGCCQCCSRMAIADAHLLN